MVRQTNYAGPQGVAAIELDNRVVTVILAPAPRLNFRGLTEEVLRPGVTVTVQGLPSRQTADEFRAEIVAVQGREFDMR